MHMYLKNNTAKFHPDVIINVGALGFLEDVRPNKNKNNEMNSNKGSVPDQKNQYFVF